MRFEKELFFSCRVIVVGNLFAGFGGLFDFVAEEAVFNIIEVFVFGGGAEKFVGGAVAFHEFGEAWAGEVGDALYEFFVEGEIDEFVLFPFVVHFLEGPFFAVFFAKHGQGHSAHVDVVASGFVENNFVYLAIAYAVGFKIEGFAFDVNLAELDGNALHIEYIIGNFVFVLNADAKGLVAYFREFNEFAFFDTHLEFTVFQGGHTQHGVDVAHVYIIEGLVVRKVADAPFHNGLCHELGHGEHQKRYDE